MYLVGYDLAGVHRYVFEPVRPADILGGSLLLEQFADGARSIASGAGADTIFSGGGRGMFQVADEASARRLADELRQLVEQTTAGGVRCAVAWAELYPDFRATVRELESRLRKTRLHEHLVGLPRDLVPPGSWPDQLCQGCGRELGTRTRTVGGDIERIGPRCEARWVAGRGRSPSVPELFGVGKDELPRGGVLGALYLDGDDLGARLGDIADPAQLKTFTSRVADGLRQGLQWVREVLRDLPLVQVAAGGDDLVLFCDARQLLNLAEALWEQTSSLGRDLGIRFSTGLVVGEPLLPLRLYFSEAEEALRAAKRRSYATGRPHVGVRGLMAGMRSGRRGDLFGGPLPQEVFRSSSGPTVVDLIRKLHAVVPAQRAGLGDDLALESSEEARLAVEARGLRKEGEAVGEALAIARAVARTLGSAAPDELDLLRGGLVFATIGQR